MQKKKIIVQARLTEEQYKAIVKYAHKKETTISSIIRNHLVKVGGVKNGKTNNSNKSR